MKTLREFLIRAKKHITILNFSVSNLNIFMCFFSNNLKLYSYIFKNMRIKRVKKIDPKGHFYYSLKLKSLK